MLYNSRCRSCVYMRVLLLFLLFPILCFSQYNVQSVPFSPQLENGTSLPMVDDDVSGVIPIGFVFCFCGNSYSQAYIGTNGWVGFSAGQPISFTPFPIPTTNAFVPKNCIMAPFHDMNPGFPTPLNYIKYYTAGIAPFRRFVVTWDSIPMYQCTILRAKQQVVLYETTNVIETTIFRKPVCPIWVNGRAIHGLHNFNGTQAIIVGTRNATVWGTTMMNETTRFVPNDPCICSTIPSIPTISHN